LCNLTNVTERKVGDEAREPHGELAEELQVALTRVLRWASRAGVRGRWLARDVTEGLTSTDAWLVEALAERGPMRVTALADWQGVDKSTVTPQVRRLERAGLVDRAPDPDDGRASRLTLSAKGEAVREQVRRSGAGVIEEQMASWSEEDRRSFARLLGRFAAGLDEVPIGKGAPNRKARVGGEDAGPS
jgi:DNA-binding MarR family transcriptional regulator